jgi:hypothetical protein
LLIFLLGIFYTIIFCILFKWFDKKQHLKIRIGSKWIILAFVFKVIAGITYGYLYAHYFKESDSWTYFNESLTDYYNLLHHLPVFFSLQTNTGSITDFFSTQNNAFWSNAGDNILIKILGVFNLFSGGNYYVDSILFNLFSFIGLYLIYAVCAIKFTINKLWIFLVIFFLPSNLFWGSGIAKEGLIAFFSGLLIYTADKIISSAAHKVKNILLLMFGLCGILLMRTATALIFFPALISWYISTKIKSRSYIIYTMCYITFIALFFLSIYFNSKFNLPLNLADKQHQFLLLEGNSRLELTPLKPTFASYLSVLPQALNHIFLRPYLNEIKTPFYLLTFTENLLVLLIILMCVFFTKKQMLKLLNPFSLFCISLALTGYLLIGYTVPFSGAIIRYKAFYTIFLLLPFINFIDLKHLHKHIIFKQMF